MTHAIRSFLPPMHGLPDPDLDRGFYEGVPARRLAAWIVDFLIVAAISLFAIPVLGILTLGLGFLVAPAVYWFISFLYRVTTLGSRSATWGMRLMAIELRDARGFRFGFGLAFAHVSLYSLSVFLAVPLVLSAVTALVTPYNQTLHDLLLRTSATNLAAD